MNEEKKRNGGMQSTVFGSIPSPHPISSLRSKSLGSHDAIGFDSVNERVRCKARQMPWLERRTESLDDSVAIIDFSTRGFNLFAVLVDLPLGNVVLVRDDEVACCCLRHSYNTFVTDDTQPQ